MKRMIVITALLCSFYFISVFAISQRSYQKGFEEMLEVSYSVGSVAIINTEKVLIFLKAVAEKELVPYDVYSHRYIIESSLMDLFSIESRISKEQFIKICRAFNDDYTKRYLIDTYKKHVESNYWGMHGLAKLIQKCGGISDDRQTSSH